MNGETATATKTVDQGLAHRIGRVYAQSIYNRTEAPGKPKGYSAEKAMKKANKGAAGWGHGVQGGFTTTKLKGSRSEGGLASGRAIKRGVTSHNKAMKSKAMPKGRVGRSKKSKAS